MEHTIVNKHKSECFSTYTPWDIRSVNAYTNIQTQTIIPLSIFCDLYFIWDITHMFPYTLAHHSFKIKSKLFTRYTATSNAICYLSVYQNIYIDTLMIDTWCIDTLINDYIDCFFRVCALNLSCLDKLIVILGEEVSSRTTFNARYL